MPLKARVWHRPSLSGPSIRSLPSSRFSASCGARPRSRISIRSIWRRLARSKRSSSSRLKKSATISHSVACVSLKHSFFGCSTIAAAQGNPEKKSSCDALRFRRAGSVLHAQFYPSRWLQLFRSRPDRDLLPWRMTTDNRMRAQRTRRIDETRPSDQNQSGRWPETVSLCASCKGEDAFLIPVPELSIIHHEQVGNTKERVFCV